MINICLLIILGVIVLINIFESSFCALSKKRAKKKNDRLEETGEKKHVNKSKVATVYSWINSFTFLYFKIVGYIPSHHIRRFIYKYVFKMTIGKGTVIYYGLEARNPWNIIIGNRCSIGDKVILDAREKIVIEDNVNISTGAWIWTVQHDVNSEKFETAGEEKPIHIEDYAWVSSRTTILPGANIKKGDVIAAGAVLVKPCNSPYAIYGGVPAKEIGVRNNKLQYNLTEKYRHFL